MSNQFPMFHRDGDLTLDVDRYGQFVVCHKGTKLPMRVTGVSTVSFGQVEAGYTITFKGFKGQLPKGGGPPENDAH